MYRTNLKCDRAGSDSRVLVALLLWHTSLLMNIKLHTATLGQGQPLIMLHGWGWHSGIWQALLPDLTKQYQVTIVDLPGFGLSSALVPQDYTLSNIVQALLSIAPEAAHWLGWSLGGLIATTVALEAPERVKSLINVTSSPYFVATTDWPGMKLTTLNNFTHLLAEDFQKALRDFSLLQLHGMANARPLLRQLQANVLTKYVPTVESLVASLQLLQQHDLRLPLAQINCPCLYILGRLDALVPITMMASLPHYLPSAQYAVIEHASHMPFLSHTEEFMRALNGFLHKNHSRVV